MGHTILGQGLEVPPAVHPHIRGAYKSHTAPGKTGNWFIPTYVGHTSAAGRWVVSFSVHPHLRGAYYPLRNLALIIFGSSPPTWGIPPHQRLAPAAQRFIPTYVGHTMDEKRRMVLDLGSSPPTWGIQYGKGVPVSAYRFIPTYVGHTISVRPMTPRTTVHPHLRGAYVGDFNRDAWNNGSSPPTWGILEKFRRRCYQFRFIPTYVGHTGLEVHQARFSSVHPHLRGAYCQKLASTSSACGSSPPTWGIRSGTLLPARTWRFIPTYVGHTDPVLSGGGRKTVHPHLRGAYA